MMWNYKEPYCFYFFLWISRYKAHIPLKAKMRVEKFIIHNKTSRGITDRRTQSKISVKIRDHISPRDNQALFPSESCSMYNLLKEEV